MKTFENIPFIDLKSQYIDLKQNINKRINNVLDHGIFINGPEVSIFEEDLCNFTSVKHSISCANGTDALSIALMALNTNRDDVVFVPSFTYISSVEAIALLGATPFFVDVDFDFNICPVSLENAILDSLKLDLKPSVVIPVDLFGKPSKSEKLDAVIAKYNLKVIYDAAQSFGAEYKGEKVGNFGDITTTSFFPAKPLGCYGDGGALFTNDDVIASKIRSIKNHGMGNHKYEHINLGMNSRLDTIQAAILIEKLDVFSKELITRNEIARFYSNNINDIDKLLITPEVKPGNLFSWAQYTLISPKRDEIMKKLKELSIPTAIYYPLPLNKQEAYKDNYVVSSGIKNSEKLCKQVFSLPMSPYLDRTHQDYIISSLNKIIDDL